MRLLELGTPAWPMRPLSLHVLRNQSFEPLCGPLEKFAAFAGLTPTITLGGYDDALADLDVGDAEGVLVWLDYERYGPEQDLLGWLMGRLQVLRKASAAPILVADRPHRSTFNCQLAQRLSALPGVDLFPLSRVARQLGDRFVDPRMGTLTGTALSDQAFVSAAKELGLRWLSALAGSRIKAVIVDLDQTLYGGVLGEDGPEGIIFTAGHRALARCLSALQRRGTFLGILSRNDPRDVDALWRLRPDFPLRRDQISAQAVGWDRKDVGLKQMLGDLRIGPEAALFVDDNPGELAAVVDQVPGVRTLWADPSDPGATARALGAYPGIHTAGTREDSLRATDLAAQARRQEEEARSTGPDDYIRSLGTVLTVALKPLSRVRRLHELSMKTNQFNTTLARLSEETLSRFMATGHIVAAGEVRDRLSDSGTVASLVAHREGVSLVVDELAVSCRALGRGVETPFVLAVLARVLKGTATDEVVFRYVPGPRNDPARAWIVGLTGCNPDQRVGAVMRWDPEAAETRLTESPITVEWEE